jgi:hypothetical protein
VDDSYTWKANCRPVTTISPFLRYFGSRACSWSPTSPCPASTASILFLKRPAMAFGELYEFLEVVLSFARPQETVRSKEVHVSHLHQLHGAIRMRSVRVSTTSTLLAYRPSARWLAFSARPKNISRRTRSGLIRTVVSRLGNGLRCGQRSSTWSRLRSSSAPRRGRHRHDKLAFLAARMRRMELTRVVLPTPGRR